MADEVQEFLDYEGLAEYHSKVNDMTTGINLLRGTRDFQIGTKPFYTFNDLYTDGFFNRSNGFTFYDDPDGYKVARREVTSSNVGSTNSAFLNTLVNGSFSAGDTITLSFEVMSPNPSEVLDWRLAGFQQVNSDGTYTQASLISVAKALDANTMEANKWYKVVLKYKVESNIDNVNSKLALRLIVTNIGTVCFRKVKVEIGNINHPVWSTSPFDVSSSGSVDTSALEAKIDKINDYTTGINLVRGSRDFAKGTKSVVSYFYTDGFYESAAGVSRSKDSDGFTVITASSTTSRNGVWTVPVTEVKHGETYTFSFDIKINKAPESIYNTDLVQAITLTPSNTSTNTQGSGWRINKNLDVIDGEWHRISFTMTINDNVEEDAFIVFRALVPANQDAEISVRKLKTERGSINKPLWSLNPFDISSGSSVDTSELEAKIDKINDYTTGINLLRGTRDFTEGNSGFTIGKYYDNGFWFIDGKSHYVFTKDQEGFTILSTTENSGTRYIMPSKVYGIKAGDTYTLSFDVKVPSDRALIDSTKLVAVINVYSEEGKTVTDNRTQIINVTQGQLGITEPDKWYRVSIPFTVNSNDSLSEESYIGAYLYTRLGENYYYDFRKFKLEHGSINKPVWSISPFDISSGSSVDTSELEAKIDKINDYTTGINLLSGTRDFRQGTKARNQNVTAANTVYKDGFVKFGNSTTEFHVNDNGFTVLTIPPATQQTGYRSSYVDDIKPGQVFTASVDIMVDSAPNTSYNCFSVSLRNPETNVNKNAVALKTNLIKEVGTWVRYTVEYVIPESLYSDGDLICINTYADPGINTTVHFKCLKLEEGSINKPLYSVSPNDVDAINDMTTGINLLRGTRDFKIGNTVSSYDKVFTDGFSNPNTYKFKKDIEGFTIAYLDSLSGATKTLNCSSVDIRNFEYITICFEFMFTNKGDESLHFIGNFNTYDNSGNRSKFIDIKVTDIGLTMSSIEVGKWYKYVKVLKVSDYIIDDYNTSVLILSTYSGTLLEFRKCCIYEGYINHPLWSASPFDVAQQSSLDSINDETTGINLLRGTRDFVLGDPSHQIPTSKGTFYSNGFSNTGNFEFYKDDQGFTVASKSGNGSFGLYTVVQDSGIAGKSMTLSFDIKLDNISEFNTTNAAFAVSYYDGSELVAINRVNISDVINKGAQDGKWLNYVDYLTIPSSNVEFVYITMAKYVGNGTISFRKLMLQEGHINHPIWSPSPFDTDYINDEPTGINLLLGTRDFIFGSHKTPQNSYVYSDGFYKTSLAPGVTYTTYKDDQGFTVCHLENTLSATIGVYSSACYGLEKGNYTVSFDCKIESKDENVSLNTLLSSINYTGGSISKIDTNDPFKHQNDDHDWHTYTIHFNLSNDLPENSFVYVYILITGRAVVNFRKAGMYKGYINNPVWSASPFDVVEKSDLNADNLKGIVPWEKGGTNSNSRIAANNNIFTNVTPQVVMPDLDNPVSYGVNLYSDATSNKISGLNYATVFTIGTHTNFTSGYRNQFIFNAQNNRVWYRNKTDSGQWAAPATLAYLSDLAALTSQIQTLQAALLSNGTITTEDLEKASQQSTIQEISSQDDNEVDNHDSSIADVNQHLPNESNELPE